VNGINISKLQCPSSGQGQWRTVKSQWPLT